MANQRSKTKRCINIWVPDDLKRMLEEVAKRTGRTMTEVASEMLKNGLEDNETSKTQEGDNKGNNK